MLAVHLTTAHDPFDTRILRRECVSLANDLALEVRLLNAYGIDDKFQGVVLQSFDSLGSRLKRLTVSIFRAYNAAAHLNADIYHLHDPELLFVGMMLKRKGHRVIFDCHEDFFEKAKAREWIPRVMRKPVGYLYKAIARIILPRLDYVIAATEDIENGLSAKRSAVVRNLPRVSDIQSNTGAVNRESGLILYTGGLTSNRGIEQVVRGLVDHCSACWRLVVLGNEDEGVAKRLGGYLSDPRIEYRGRVPFEEVVYWMGISSIGVVCNQPRFGYQDALPNKLFEYMAAGLPVVCSAFPQWTELVEARGAGVTCDPEDLSSIGAACSRLLLNPQAALEMGKRGQDVVEKELSWEKEFMKLKTVYQQCLNEG